MTFSDFIIGVNALVTLGIAILSYLNRNAIHELHLSLNSRLTELLARNKESSIAEGRELGRSEKK